MNTPIETNIAEDSPLNTGGRNMTVFFCVGSEKSGTTLLARMLDQHPEIACLWESYAFRPESSASIFNPASEKWKRHGFSESDVRRWSRIWNAQPHAFFRRTLSRLTRSNFLVDSCFRRTMSSALADFARRCDATVVGDKWPGYIRHLDQLLSACPEARIIYNVRDPRGLWNSAESFKGRCRGDELLGEMLENDKRIRPYLERANFLTIRYEDLVCEPEGTAQRMYEFLGCDFSTRYLQYDHESIPIRIAGAGYRRPAARSIPGMRSSGRSKSARRTSNGSRRRPPASWTIMVMAGNDPNRTKWVDPHARSLERFHSSPAVQYSGNRERRNGADDRKR